MNSVLEESTVERGTEIEVRFAGTTCGGLDTHEVAKRIEKGVKEAKAAVSAKLEDGKIEAGRYLKRGRYAVEDGISETTHKIKHHPVTALAIAFAAGAALGFLAPRVAKK